MSKQEELGIALGSHLDDRLQALLDNVDEIAGFWTSNSMGEKWDGDTVLTVLQLEDGRVTAFMRPEEARRISAALTVERVRALRVRAERLAHTHEPVAAFAEFADVEDAFEQVEHEVDEMLRAIDNEIQLQIDIARGK